MLAIKKEGIILQKTSNEFENDGVCNPAIMQEGNTVHILYRAVRKGNYSTIGYCKLEGPLKVVERNQTPLLSPIAEFESHGMEDPRIVKIEDIYYLSYTAYDGINALGALATSFDLTTIERHGIIVPQITYEEFQRLAECNAHLNEKYERFHVHNNIKNNPNKTMLLWDKNLIFFPRKIENKIYFLHRIRPDIQIACVTNLNELNVTFWQNYFLHLDKNIVLSPKYPHEISYIGGGCPPIETKEGWLIIYHGVHDTKEGYVYSACAALLDLQHPEIEIARLPYPLFIPELPYELKGEVDNVVFPTGTAVFEERLFIYYGAADKHIAVASIELKQLIKELEQHPTKIEKETITKDIDHKL
ncbi:MAG: pesticidal protein Cry7Aa [Bacteroidota bacterium]